MNIFATTTVALTLLVTSVAALPEAGTDDDTQLGAMAEQIDIMRLVLARSINTAFTTRIAEENPDTAGDAPAPSVPAGDADDTSAAAALRVYAEAVARQRTQFTSHTRGFYAAGVGVLYTTEVNTPVLEIEASPEPQDEPDEPDEWTEAAEQVRSGSGFGRAYIVGQNVARFPSGSEPTRTCVVDDAFIDLAVDSVLRAVGRHGMKITDLPERESIIVAIRFSPGSSSYPALAYAAPPVAGGRGASVGGRSGSGRGRGIGGGGGGVAVSPLAPNSTTTTRTLWRSGGDADPVHVVIRIDRSDLADLEGSETRDLRKLKKAAVITRY